MSNQKKEKIQDKIQEKKIFHNIGLELEKKISELLFQKVGSQQIFKGHNHNVKIPFLISPMVLREQGAGQVDLAYYDLKQKLIVIVEVKKSGHTYFQANQHRRLMKAAKILSAILDKSVIIRCFADDNKDFAKF